MNYCIYIFTIGSFLTLGFAFHLLLIKYGNKYLNRLLALVLIHRSFQMLYFISVSTDQTVVASFLYPTLYPLYFVFPACMYLYIRGFLKEESHLQKNDWFHFIPFAFALIDTFSNFIQYGSFKEDFTANVVLGINNFQREDGGFFSSATLFPFRTILVLIYLFINWRLIFRLKVINNMKFNSLATKWVVSLLGYITLNTIVYTLVHLFHIFKLSFLNHSISMNYYLVYFCVSILVGISFVFYNPKILYGYLIVTKYYVDLLSNNTKKVIAEDGIMHIEDIKKEKSSPVSISAELVKNEQRYLIEICYYMESQKPYLNPEFSISILSQETGITVYHCSYVINHLMEKNFREWVNTFRIEHFVEQYASFAESKTILALSMDCGFKNKGTFYKAFVKEKGVLPLDYFRSKVSLLC